MTNQEASKIIKDGLEDMSLDFVDEEQYEALNMAIKALEHPEQNVITVMPCGDTISRQAVLDALEMSYLKSEIDDLTYQRIKKLPPVKQEPKIGHWIPTYGNVKCSVCGSVKESRRVGKATHYCDFCGAKMVEQEERDKE